MGRKGPVGGAGPLAFARFPLTTRGCLSTDTDSMTVRPRPFAASFVVEPCGVGIRRRQSMG